MNVIVSIRGVVYRSDSFYVLKVKDVESNEEFTARGNLYGLSTACYKAVLGLSGKHRKHPRYGNQFAFKTWFPGAEEPADVSRFLSMCVGITDWGAISRISELGPDAFDALSNGVSALQELGISSEASQDAALKWSEATAQRDLSGLLEDGGLDVSDIQVAMSQFGADAASVIRGNPYRLLEVLRDFPKVDKLAMKMGSKTEDPRRVEGAVLWALQEMSRQGHLFLRRGEVSDVLSDLFRRSGIIGVSDDLVSGAIQALVDRRAVVLEENVGVYLPPLHKYESRTPEMLAELLMKPSEIDVDFKSFLESYERGNRIKLSASQRAAVECLGENRVMVLTGLPGTGKSTSVKALVRLFEEAGLSFDLMAPTGIAAKRLSAVTGKPASTVHRALGYDGSTWSKGPDNRYVVDAVVVDETSMVDQELMFRLLSALRPDTILVLVGDDAQLPSVGPGNVLRELVASGIPHVRLTQIFRQSERGEIVANSHRINRGEMPVLVGAKEKSELRFVRISEESRVADLIVGMAEKLKKRDANFQVLSPKYKGDVGIDSLNERLRECLNPPGPKEWVRGKTRFRLGDRLMVVQNDYQLGVYNGDMGKLAQISHDSIVLKIHGIGPRDPDVMVRFTFDVAVEKLRLAYAISIHRSQGGEFDTIILPVVRSQGGMLQRNLLYTAVTRARKQVWLLGEEGAIGKAIANNPAVKRNTVLAQTLGVRLTNS